MTQLIYSLTAFFEGYAFISKRPHLYKYIAWAIIFNIIVLFIVFIAVFFLYIFIINQLVNQVSFDLPLLLEVSLGALGVILSGLLVALLFGTVSGVANSIVYGKLTDAVLEELLIADEREKLLNIGPLEDIRFSLSFEFKKLFLSLVLFALSGVFSLIPIIGVVLTTLMAVLTLIIFNGLDAYEPALTRANYNFRSKIGYIFRKPLVNIPFAIIAGTVNSIILLNIFTIPFTIVGAAILYNRGLK